MLALTAFCFSLLFSAVLGFPLSERDVFNPHITNPHNGTVWVVGSKETVTWDTSDLPPDSQLTSPTGRVILGHMGGEGGLNLQLEHPLAQGFKLREGKVSITVPDVPTRDDYLIVLMGDSGNASPTFVITSISGGSSSSAKSSGTVRAVTSSTSLITSAIPISGTEITGGTASTTVATDSPSASAPGTTATAPVSSPAASSLSQTLAQGGTAAPASTSTSDAWSIHSIRLWPIIAASLASTLFV